MPSAECPKNTPLRYREELPAPHHPIDQWLTQPLDHIVKSQDGSVEDLSFVVGTSFVTSAAYPPTSGRQSAFSGTLTVLLLVAPYISDEAYQVLREVLTHGGMILNYDKCIA